MNATIPGIKQDLVVQGAQPNRLVVFQDRTSKLY